MKSTRLRLQRRKPLTRCFQGLIEKQLRYAARAIAPGEDPHRAVHELRLANKRVAALLQLVEPASKSASNKNNALGNLQRAAKTLAGVRDACVQHDLLCHADGQLDEARTDIEARYGQALEDYEGKLRRKAAAQLKIAREQPIELTKVTRENVLRRAIQCYAKLGVIAQSPPSHEKLSTLHSWRQLAKVHGYHLELLQPIAPGYLEPRLHALHAIDDLLGDHRDLTLLLRQLPGSREHTDLTRRLDTALADAADVSRWALATPPADLHELLRQRWQEWRHS